MLSFETLFNEAVDKNNPVSNSLNKFQTLAKQKGIQNIGWVSLELNGYGEGDQLPDCRRKIAGSRKTSFPSIWSAMNKVEPVSLSIDSPIDEIERLVETTEGSTITIKRYRFNIDISVSYPLQNIQRTVSLTVDRSELKKILRAARQRLRDELATHVSEEARQKSLQKMSENQEDLPTPEKKGVFRRIGGFFREHYAKILIPVIAGLLLWGIKILITKII